MTAPAPRPGPDVAGRLAEALPHTAWCPVFVVIDAGCKCLASRRIHADRLLPTVRAAMDQRAAEELEAAADGFAYTPLSERESGQVSGYTRGWHNAADALRARAAALRGEGRG